jgi:hypothetical protein
MDSSESPTRGEQEGSACNGHFGCTCYHPLFLFRGVIGVQPAPPGGGFTMPPGMIGSPAGMLVVETVAKIHRLHFVQGVGIKAICRDLGLSRKMVRKVLRSGETEFRHERTRQPLPKLGAWQADLDRILEENVARSPRARLTLIRVFEDQRQRSTTVGCQPSCARTPPTAKPAR